MVPWAADRGDLLEGLSHGSNRRSYERLLLQKLPLNHIPHAPQPQEKPLFRGDDCTFQLLSGAQAPIDFVGDSSWDNEIWENGLLPGNVSPRFQRVPIL